MNVIRKGLSMNSSQSLFLFLYDENNISWTNSYNNKFIIIPCTSDYKQVQIN